MNRAYAVHDEGKDKPFVLEMSWLKDGKFESVPKALLDEAESAAKRALEEDDMEED